MSRQVALDAEELLAGYAFVGSFAGMSISVNFQGAWSCVRLVACSAEVEFLVMKIGGG